MPFSPEYTPPVASDEVRQFLESIGSRTDFPSFSANVQSITTVSRDMEAQIGRLHDAIVQDVSLTAKVLQIANTVACSGGGSTITSVRQAILMLGFERVRHLALAASVFEHLHRKTPVVRELMALSLINANQSYHLAIQAGYAKAEVAYLSGMFQNIGEVLVACYRPREYARWLALLARSPRRAPGSERKVFGVCFDEIGTALAVQWRMPPEIIGSMRGSPSVGGEQARTLVTIARLSVALTNAIYRYESAAQPGALTSILQQYARPLGLDEKTVRETAEQALSDSRATLSAVNAAVNGLRLTAQIAVATTTLGDMERTPRVTGSDAASPDVASADGGYDDDLYGDVSGDETADSAGSREDRTREALDALEAARSRGEELEVGRVSRAALDAICGAGYRRAVLALSSEDFARVRGRLGSGEGHERATREFLIRLTTGTSSLANALTERQDVFTDAEAWPAIKRDALLRSLAPKSFGLLPLVHGDRLLGCLYFDDTEEPVSASEELRGLLCGIRDQLVNAFAEQRQRAAA